VFLALSVPKNEAQRTLQKAIDAGLLDRDRKVLQKGGHVEIPVTSEVPGHETVCQSNPLFYRREPELAEFLGEKVPSWKIDLLPRGWSIQGSVIAVKINPKLDGMEKDIGDALLAMYPRCKCVLKDWGIEGQFREPKREVIAGEGSETLIKENGVLFKLDAMRTMFSAGNLDERIRMSHFGRDEFVVDMFAGVGYFSLPMAVHSRPDHVLSIELNPVAYGYLKENVRLNHVEEIVEPVLGDCSKVTPKGVADRVVMGYVGTTDRYLDFGIRALKPGGQLHYHQTVPEWLYPSALEKDVKEAAACLGRTAQIEGRSKVKKYSPGMVHAVLDVAIE